MTAYCVRCKVPVTVLNAQEIRLKNGRPAIKGHCRECLGKVFRILMTPTPVAPR